jgi:hypothetical protein
MSVVVTANVILFIASLLVWLSNVIAEQRRSVDSSTPTGEQRENMSKILLIGAPVTSIATWLRASWPRHNLFTHSVNGPVQPFGTRGLKRAELLYA